LPSPVNQELATNKPTCPRQMIVIQSRSRLLAICLKRKLDFDWTVVLELNHATLSLRVVDLVLPKVFLNNLLATNGRYPISFVTASLQLQVDSVASKLTNFWKKLRVPP